MQFFLIASSLRLQFSALLARSLARSGLEFQFVFAVLGLAGQIWPDLAWKALFANLPYCSQSAFAVLGLAGQI